MKEYLDLVKLVIEEGTQKKSRTGVDTISFFDAFYKVDLQKGFPLLTTKKVEWKSLLNEVLWYLSGDNHIRNLRQHTKIWDAWQMRIRILKRLNCCEKWRFPSIEKMKL